VKSILLFAMLCTIAIFPGCSASLSTQINGGYPAKGSATPALTETVMAERTPTLTSLPKNTTTGSPKPSATSSSTPTAMPVGPDDFPVDINPLSGLPVDNVELLNLPPALVSISNAPLPTRPQAGLSFSPLVFEIYIGEGVSRYLTIFYGDYPMLVSGSPGDVDDELEDAVVGPIRSGRLPYEKLRQLYNGFLVFASASSRVLPYLDEYYIFYNEEKQNYNLAFLPVAELQNYAEQMLENHSKRALHGLKFDSNIQPGGKDARTIWIPFHELDQVVWKFNPQIGSYNRYQDQEDGKTFIKMTDRLNGDALAFENIIILFADYTFFDATLFDIELMYLNRYPALLFRDGKMTEIFWTTANEEFEASTGFLRPIRFVDEQGQAVALKHGQTWVEIIPRNSPYYEIPATDDYANLSLKQESGSASWLVYFQQPPIPEVVETEESE